ncbi:YdcF family protein [Frankia sp. CNm7]|uniref:YdcF family protein n=1 Tax=Frankia nepalensis TaxID=1836974 RepID=A0A937RQG6_9ACTN|nr:YdcF family protein [Frankia nepalensis]MBL7495025.1 YdcF family protein [Frankia nepalensis]MBL7515594.1 YdcF family protein [Frankia nepalensis]MBL7519168.1 YdcF family protein [Frankia nepalensis]MBL7633115.1 YdcF family protein [Frankia nepalensis]
MIPAFLASGNRAARPAEPGATSEEPSPASDRPARRAPTRRPRLLRGLRAPWWLWLIRLVAAFVVAVLIAGVVTVGQVWWAGRQDHRPRSDALVVLGASQYNGRPSAVFAARLEHAAELYRAGVAPLVITVGGRVPGDQFTEAGVGVSYLRDLGVPASALLAVPEGRDTLESLVAVAGEMNTRSLRSAVIVTDRWHTLRSVSMARDLGLTATGSPVTTGPANRGVHTQARYIIREAVGYRFYQLFHRATPPAARQPAI